MRRKDGEPRVFDESFTTNDSGRFDRSWKIFYILAWYFFKFQVFLKKFFIFFPVTDISDLEQRLRDLPLNSGDVDDADVISTDSEVGPNNFRPWENYAERGLPSCKNHWYSLSLSLGQI